MATNGTDIGKADGYLVELAFKILKTLLFTVKYSLSPVIMHNRENCFIVQCFLI